MATKALIECTFVYFDGCFFYIDRSRKVPPTFFLGEPLAFRYYIGVWLTMRKLSLILTIAMLVMAVIIIPVGISNVYLALQLGLIFECVSSIFFLCLFIAFCLFEVREFIREYSWYYEEAPVEGMHDMQDDDVPF